ncbi:MAG: acyl-CoA dehydrogenase [Gammaproteobacteria bacterium]|nr:acyl-CoA dehydrogenase [Gammaproteobacteria bacterium]MBQ0839648.1 acyl-CoA dehydrogenase [Gammaproteobacteria bacterium]
MTPITCQEARHRLEAEISLSLQKANIFHILQEEYTQPTSFPFKTWKRLAEQQLLQRFTTNTSLANPPYTDIALTGYLMSRQHRSLGLTMTWLGQLLKTHFLRTLGCHDPAYIDAILNGDSLCALAISEPNVGAHPKHLSCSASKDGANYILNGEKAFVSHGPYADRFIVLAITSQQQGRKHFSAFLVPADSAGLQLMPPQPVKGLHPSSHCNIVFTDCRIPCSTLIGTSGHAFAEISLPMRTLEDSLMLAPIAGAMQAQLDYLAHPSTPHRSPLEQQKLGQLLSLTESAKELGIIAASKLEQQTCTPDLTALIIGFRSLVEQVQTALLEWHDEYPGLRELANDIKLLNNIGRQATAARTVSLAEHFLVEQRKKG